MESLNFFADWHHYKITARTLLQCRPTGLWPQWHWGTCIWKRNLSLSSRTLCTPPGRAGQGSSDAPRCVFAAWLGFIHFCCSGGQNHKRMVEVRHPTSHFSPGSRLVLAGQGPAPGEGFAERGKAHPGWFSHHGKAKQKVPRGWPTFRSCFPGGSLPHSSVFTVFPQPGATAYIPAAIWKGAIRNHSPDVTKEMGI